MLKLQDLLTSMFFILKPSEAFVVFAHSPVFRLALHIAVFFVSKTPLLKPKLPPNRRKHDQNRSKSAPLKIPKNKPFKEKDPKTRVFKLFTPIPEIQVPSKFPKSAIFPQNNIRLSILKNKLFVTQKP
jgi:hypothetical protein